jgi:polysaccharide export outer membrane protein
LVTLRPVVVNVVGEVYRPGPVQLSSFTQGNTQLDPAANLTTTTNSPTLHAALIAAGGLKRSADVRQVVIQRPLPNGKTTEFTLNLWDMLTVGDNFNVTLLLDGDSIYVPPLAENNPLDQRFIASSSLAPATVRVRVIGEVKQPGEVSIPPNSSLSSAVAAAGGPTPDAQLDNVLLVRLNELGQVQESSVNLNNLVDNYQVQEGDVVVVAKKGYLSFVDNVYRFLNPVLIPLNLLNLLRVAN